MQTIKNSKNLGKNGYSLLFLLGAYLFFALSAQYFSKHSVSLKEQLLSVHFPVPVQLITSGGDRFFASNLATMRATVVGTSNLDKKTMVILASVQDDASWFNPAQEDNYYLASANLPWEGQLDAAQNVLRRATKARPTDPWPPFYYGFNRQYFLGDYIGAAKAAELAAARVDGAGKSSLLNIAAKWYERVDNPKLAVAMIKDLKNKSSSQELANRLDKRLQRIHLIEVLDVAVNKYEIQFGHKPKDLEELKQSGFISNLPVDPLGGSFGLKNGKVVVNAH